MLPIFSTEMFSFFPLGLSNHCYHILHQRQPTKLSIRRKTHFGAATQPNWTVSTISKLLITGMVGALLKTHPSLLPIFLALLFKVGIILFHSFSIQGNANLPSSLIAHAIVLCA